MFYKWFLKVNAFFGVCLLLLSMASSLAGADEVFMDFNAGVYLENEWIVTNHNISARYIPYKRSPFTYPINKRGYTKIKGVSMDMQLRTTTGVARANVYMECGGTRDGFQMNTYPHPQLWKNLRHWEMSDHCLERLNATGEVRLLVKLYWDGHGIFHLLNLKMEAE